MSWFRGHDLERDAEELFKSADKIFGDMNELFQKMNGVKMPQANNAPARIRMKPLNQPFSIHGTLTVYNPAGGKFSVVFDLPINGVSAYDFTYVLTVDTTGKVVHTHIEDQTGASWELLSV